MTNETFKAGEKVFLKSGGPTMTIKEIGEFQTSDGALCQWFNDKNKLDEAVFPLTSLERYSRENDPNVATSTNF